MATVLQKMFKERFVSSFFFYEYYRILIKLTLGLKKNCDDFVIWLNSNGSRNKNVHHFAYVIFYFVKANCRILII